MRKIHPQPTGFELSKTGTSFWSIVDANNVEYDFASLGFQIITYQGFGLAPINNVTQSYGLTGGAFLQRTILKPRTLTLIGVFQDNDIRSLEKKQFTLFNILQPNVLTDTAAVIKLRYRLRDEAGNAVGTPLEMACTFNGTADLTRDNLYQEKIGLVFQEYNPPSIHELTANSSTMPVSTSVLVTTPGELKRTSAGQWTLAATSPVYSFDFKTDGTKVFGGGVNLRIGAVDASPNNTVFSVLVRKTDNRVFAGGDFTQLLSIAKNRLAYSDDNGTTWIQASAAINSTVRGMCYAQNGTIYVTGAFTAPQTRVMAYDGNTTFTALGTGFNADGYCCIQGLDGYIYFGGNFTTANGVACVRIAKWTGTTFVPLGSGMNGIVRCLAVGKDGRLYAGGDFTTAGGVTVNYIAVWNGSQWQALGAGLNGAVWGIDFDSNNNLLVAGAFSSTSDGSYPLPYGLAKWNGSLFVPIDCTFNTGATMGSISQNPYTLDLEIGTNSVSSSRRSVATIITNTGSTAAYPTFTHTSLSGGTLFAIINNTTGAALYFNYTVLTGETLTLTLNPNGLSFTSSAFGDIISKILPGSDVSNFGLAVGANSISVLFVVGNPATETLGISYYNTHMSFLAASN